MGCRGRTRPSAQPVRLRHRVATPAGGRRQPVRYCPRRAPAARAAGRGGRPGDARRNPAPARERRPGLRRGGLFRYPEGCGIRAPGARRSRAPLRSAQVERARSNSRPPTPPPSDRSGHRPPGRGRDRPPRMVRRRRRCARQGRPAETPVDGYAADGRGQLLMLAGQVRKPEAVHRDGPEYSNRDTTRLARSAIELAKPSFRPGSSAPCPATRGREVRIPAGYGGLQFSSSRRKAPGAAVSRRVGGSSIRSRPTDRRTPFLRVTAVDGPVTGKVVAPPRRAFGIFREVVMDEPPPVSTRGCRSRCVPPRT